MMSTLLLTEIRMLQMINHLPIKKSLQNITRETGDASRQADPANLEDETRRKEVSDHMEDTLTTSSICREVSASAPLGAHPKKKKAVRKTIVRNKRSAARLTKEEQARLDEHMKWLCQMRNQANEKIAKLKSNAAGKAGPSAVGCDPSFPEDPIEDINCLTSTVRLSQEEREQGSQDFN